MPPFSFFMDVLSPFNVYSHLLQCLSPGPVSPQWGWFQGLSSQGTTCVAELERIELESCSSWRSCFYWLYFFQRSTMNQTSDLVFEWINGARIASAFHMRETWGQMASVSIKHLVVDSHSVSNPIHFSSDFFPSLSFPTYSIFHARWGTYSMATGLQINTTKHNFFVPNSSSKHSLNLLYELSRLSFGHSQGSE